MRIGGCEIMFRTRSARSSRRMSKGRCFPMPFTKARVALRPSPLIGRASTTAENGTPRRRRPSLRWCESTISMPQTRPCNPSGRDSPGGKWDIELWVDCAKRLDREAFDYLLSRRFDFPTAVERIELPEKHPAKLEGCFVTDVMAPLKSYYEKQRKLHYDSVSGKWDEVAEGVKGDARYMLETLCDLGCRMPDVNRLTCMQEKLKDRRGFGPKLYFFGPGFSYVVAQWPRDVELLRKVRASGFPVGGTAEQGIALEFALRGGGAPSARALVEMGFKMPAKHWFQFSIVSQKALTSRSFKRRTITRASKVGMSDKTAFQCAGHLSSV